MESELERFHKQNTQLELNITELRQKLKATEKEMKLERQKVKNSWQNLKYILQKNTTVITDKEFTGRTLCRVTCII